MTRGRAFPGAFIAGAVGRWLRDLFHLRDDTDHAGSVRRIIEDVDFRGANLWALMLATVVASVGLNLNSTAVIIGAMLISPLMGPIVGAGLAIGINDLGLLRRSVRNLLVAAIVSVLASALYFAISPLNEAQSELLARTRPTLYDVLIAFFGGSAGVIAASRKKDHANVVSGVAIATALIPPLCTAGFALATGAWRFFFGALYLFLINSVFICLATVVFVRALRFPRVHDLDAARERRVRFAIAIAIVVTVVPSAWVAWNVVQETIYVAAARRFVNENLAVDSRSVISSSIHYGRTASTIDVTVVGRPVTAEMRTDMERRLAAAGLPHTRLIIRDPLEAGERARQAGQARGGILDELSRKNQQALEARDAQIRVLEEEVVRLRGKELPVAEVSHELEALNPALLRLGFGRSVSIDEQGRPDTTVAILTTWRHRPTRAEAARLRTFLLIRLKLDTLDLVVRVGH